MTEQPDLEVIWTGAHHGQDRDLLCVPPVPVKQLGVEALARALVDRESRAQAKRDANYARVVAVLEAGGWYTAGDLMAVTHLHADEVSVVIQRLQRQGRVTRKIVPKAERVCQSWVAYRLVTP